MFKIPGSSRFDMVLPVGNLSMLLNRDCFSSAFVAVRKLPNYSLESRVWADRPKFLVIWLKFGGSFI